MMKKILPYLTVLTFAPGVFAASVEEMRQAEKQLSAAKAELSQQQTANRELEKQTQILQNTQQYLISGKKPENAVSAGNVIAAEAFNGNTPLTRFWSQVPAWAGYDDNALLINVSNCETQKDTRLHFQLPAGNISGKKLKISATFKAAGISQPPAHYLGSQFYFFSHLPDGKDFGKGVTNSFGSWDWKTASFELEVPFGVVDSSVIMGMQGVTGKIWFKDLKVEILDIKR